MEYIPANPILKYKPDTLTYLRKQYGFDSLKRVNDAIDSLEEWVSKQQHFEKKSFDRGYLERLLILNKGSVEKCKGKLDKLCTQRTLIPDLFTTERIKRELFAGAYTDALLSDMTPDHGRVHLIRFRGDDMLDLNVDAYFKYFVLMYQYLQMKDYCNHVTVIVDWQNGSVFDFISKLDFLQARKTFEICFEGFSMRVKAIHEVKDSKTIETFVNVLKSLLSTKLGDRIYIHKTMDTVYEHVPKDIFPKDYGGNDKPMSVLTEDLYNELHSSEFTQYRKEMNKARTNEALRQRDTFNQEHMGMSGTFRTLTVD